MFGICSERNDEWSEVRVQIEGAVSDLHAVEARYHVDCYSRFVSKKFLSSKNMNSQLEQTQRDGYLGLMHLIDLMINGNKQII